MSKYIIEFIGTFFLVLVIALTGDPIAIGGVLAVLVYMGGYISGGHYNPAVTLGFLLMKKIHTELALKYMLVQVIAGFVAVICARLVSDTGFVPRIDSETGLLQALFLEILFTFLLVSVVLHVAATERTKNNFYYGIAIGLTVMVGIFAAGPISGAVFNPAVAVGPILFDIANIGTNIVNLIVYLVGPLVGGTLASIGYKMTLEVDPEHHSR